MEENKLKYKYLDIFLSVFGGVFALMGFILMFANFFAGFFLLLFGAFLIPAVYEKSKEIIKKYSGKIPEKYYGKMSVFWNKNGKYMKIFLPSVFFALAAAFVIISNPSPAKTEAATPALNTEKSAEEPAESEEAEETEEKPEITSLHFDETELEMDINETKDLTLEIKPENAETEDLQYCTSNEEVASLEKTDGTAVESKVNLKLNPAGEGVCEVFAKTSEGIESNKISVKIIDNERILAEEKAKEDEEKARQEAEAQAKKEADKQAAKAAEEEQAKLQAEAKAKKKAAEKTSKAASSNAKASSSKKSTKNTNNSHGKQVYRTPHGKRYHFDPDCGGKNSKLTTLEDAISARLTPCKKCAH